MSMCKYFPENFIFKMIIQKQTPQCRSPGLWIIPPTYTRFYLSTNPWTYFPGSSRYAETPVERLPLLMTHWLLLIFVLALMASRNHHLCYTLMPCRRLLVPYFWGLLSKFTLRYLFFILLCVYFPHLFDPFAWQTTCPLSLLNGSLFLYITSFHDLLWCPLLYFRNILVSSSSGFCNCLWNNFCQSLPCPYPHHLSEWCLLQIPEDDPVSNVLWRINSTFQADILLPLESFSCRLRCVLSAEPHVCYDGREWWIYSTSACDANSHHSFLLWGEIISYWLQEWLFSKKDWITIQIIQ